MASISNPSSSSLLNLFSSFPICVSSSSMFPTSQKPSQRSKAKRHHASKVACNGNPNNNPTYRRDILIGLGGLYGATTLTSNNSGSAIAAPVSLPDPTNCAPATAVPDGVDSHCCPPSPVIDYVLPHFSKNALRIRRPAQLVSDDQEYLEKYKEAVRLMKALPDDDPRSFRQQANVHCAYCEGGYRQNGFPDRDFDVHHSWLFLPFHRWYLYFYERILGSLIGDPTFALPFWNWDNPPGMEFPSIYKDEKSPLYDPFRDASHIQKGTIVDLDYNKIDNPDLDPESQKKKNLNRLHSIMVRNGKSTSHFLGVPYRAGCLPNPGDGSLEGIHNHVHKWVGDRTQPNHEDMGNFYSAARDPVFFAHHSNVDRMWNLWKTIRLRGKLIGRRRKTTRRDFEDKDWKDSSFLFYDENKNLVRVKVEDCLDSTKMGYDYYKDVDLPWLKTKLRPKYLLPPNDKVEPVSGMKLKTLRFPFTLKSIERTPVKRPELQARSNGEKEEVLVINLDFDKCDDAKFDVFINDNGDDHIGPEHSEFAGSFVNLRHLPSSQNTRTITSFRLAITDLLKDLQVKDDDNSIAVTLVPRYGEKPVKVKDMHIKLVRVDDDDDEEDM